MFLLFSDKYSPRFETWNVTRFLTAFDDRKILSISKFNVFIALWYTRRFLEGDKNLKDTCFVFIFFSVKPVSAMARYLETKIKYILYLSPWHQSHKLTHNIINPKISILPHKLCFKWFSRRNTIFRISLRLFYLWHHSYRFIRGKDKSLSADAYSLEKFDGKEVWFLLQNISIHCMHKDTIKIRV